MQRGKKRPDQFFEALIWGVGELLNPDAVTSIICNLFTCSTPDSAPSPSERAGVSPAEWRIHELARTLKSRVEIERPLFLIEDSTADRP